jgi:hypothetical protein
MVSTDWQNSPLLDRGPAIKSAYRPADAELSLLLLLLLLLSVVVIYLCITIALDPSLISSRVHQRRRNNQAIGTRSLSQRMDSIR